MYIKCSCGNELNLEFSNNETIKVIKCPKCNKEIKIKNPNLNDIQNNNERIMNYRAHARQLFIPVLKDFQIQDCNDPQVILLASGFGFMEQLTSDGYIKDEEFEERIRLVIHNTKQYMKNNGCENVDNSFIYYKDYNNGIFNFKLYIQDLIINVQNQKKVIRNFIAYFLEPKLHDFYQLTLGAGPFNMPTELLKPGIIDLENDQITISLNNAMNLILNNLKYKS